MLCTSVDSTHLAPTDAGCIGRGEVDELEVRRREPRSRPGR
ncbi:hypothetical protein ACFPRL_11010 [Pseudoclavibacter helvolus]